MYKLTLVASCHVPKVVGRYSDLEALKAGAKQVFERYNWPAGGYWVDMDFNDADIQGGPVCVAAAHPLTVGEKKIVPYLLQAEILQKATP